MWRSRRLVTIVSDVGPWFGSYTSLVLICLSVSGMVFSKATVFPLPWQFWRLVTSVGVMIEFVFPSCPVFTMSRGFVVGPGQFPGITFIINAGEVGLGCLPRSRRSVTVVTVQARGLWVGQTELPVWLRCLFRLTVVLVQMEKLLP